MYGGDVGSFDQFARSSSVVLLCAGMYEGDVGMYKGDGGASNRRSTRAGDMLSRGESGDAVSLRGGAAGSSPVHQGMLHR